VLVDIRPHILAIDDDRDFLMVTDEFLREEGFRVTTSPALLPLDSAVALAPDLILLDLSLRRRTDGLDFLCAARRDERLRRVPIVLVTASVIDPVTANAIAAYDASLLAKPFDLDDLSLAVRRGLVPPRFGRHDIVAYEWCAL
jgi:CheY-like chemotaxis protein